MATPPIRPRARDSFWQIARDTPRSVWIGLVAGPLAFGVLSVAIHTRDHGRVNRCATVVRASIRAGMKPSDVVRAIPPWGTVVKADAACLDVLPSGVCREMVIGLSSMCVSSAPMPAARLVFGEDARVLEIQELPVL